MDSICQPTTRTGCKRCRRLNVQCVFSRTDPTSPSCSACELSVNICLQRRSTRSTKTKTPTSTAEDTPESNATQPINAGGEKAQNKYSSKAKSNLTKAQTVNSSDNSQAQGTQQGKRKVESSKVEAVVTEEELLEAKKKRPRIQE